MKGALRSPMFAVLRVQPARRRRPSGDPPRLPRPIYRSGRVYIATSTGVLVTMLIALQYSAVAAAITRADLAAVRAIADLRSAWLTDVAEAAGALASPWTWRVTRWVTLVVLVLCARWRHLAVYTGVLLVVTASTQALVEIAGRMRPAGVEILDAWVGYAFPSTPLVAIGVSLVGAMYTLAPRGRRRNQAKVVAALVVGTLVVSRLYLAVDHPSDVVVALVIGMAGPVVVFRYLVPAEVFPVRYGRRRPEILGPAREAAIREAVATDLGWDVVDVAELRPPGSAGSTPMRLVVRRDPFEDPIEIFGKLYALQHLRADRWYKLARAVRYGRLEDEHAFATVRRLVEHEDHLLRVAAEAGIPVPKTFGYVTLSPEREYLLLTEMVAGAHQLGNGPVDDRVIVEALHVVRALWRAGIAHRDVKPANIVVSGEHLWLVDLGFGELRPSAWREAVDLANMMMSLAIYASPERVYRLALVEFTEREIAEAFAAARSVTVPAQLRKMLRDRGGAVERAFDALVAPHSAIAIQRWSARRVALALALTSATAFALVLLAYNVRTVGLL